MKNRCLRPDDAYHTLKLQQGEHCTPTNTSAYHGVMNLLPSAAK